MGISSGGGHKNIKNLQIKPSALAAGSGQDKIKITTNQPMTTKNVEQSLQPKKNSFFNRVNNVKRCSRNNNEVVSLGPVNLQYTALNQTQVD